MCHRCIPSSSMSVLALTKSILPGRRDWGKLLFKMRRVESEERRAQESKRARELGELWTLNLLRRPNIYSSCLPIFTCHDTTDTPIPTLDETSHLKLRIALLLYTRARPQSITLDVVDKDSHVPSTFPGNVPPPQTQLRTHSFSPSPPQSWPQPPALA